MNERLDEEKAKERKERKRQQVKDEEELEKARKELEANLQILGKQFRIAEHTKNMNL